MDLSKLLDALRLSPRILLGIALASGALALGPEVLLERLGLKGLQASYRGWFGAALVASVALLIAHAVDWSVGRITVWRKRRKAKRDNYREVALLSPPEKAVLASYVQLKTTTQNFDMSDGVIGGLEAKQMIFRASQFSVRMTIFPYNIQPWLWEYLNDNPSVLTGASGAHWERERARQAPW